ncbi:MAG: hypothetical protein ACSHYA_05370 [Opitutaceae bacterium]
MNEGENREAKLIGRFVADSLPYVMLLTSGLGFTLIPILCFSLILVSVVVSFLGGIVCVYLHGVEEIELRCRERKMKWISYLGLIVTVFTLLSREWIFTGTIWGAVVALGFMLRIISLIKLKRIEQELAQMDIFQPGGR